MTAVYALFLGFIYRLRGGGFASLSDSVVRSLWGASLALVYLFSHAHKINWLFLCWLPFAAYMSLAFVPHAYCMNMGRYGWPQWKWPSFYMPELILKEWTGMQQWERTGYDFCSMLGVGVFRSLMLFSVYALSSSALDAINASTVVILGQAISYLIGWLVPFSFGKSLTARSTEWGELFTGFVYGVAIAWL